MSCYGKCERCVPHVSFSRLRTHIDGKETKKCNMCNKKVFSNFGHCCECRVKKNKEETKRILQCIGLVDIKPGYTVIFAKTK